MANCGGIVGKSSLIYYLITSDCQTRPSIGSMTRLGGFTAKSWNINGNPTSSTTDAYDFQVNSQTVKSFDASGSFNAFADTEQNQKEFLNFVTNHKDLGYDEPKLWILITDTVNEEVLDYMLVSSLAASKPTDGDSTYDVELVHGGELNPKFNYL